MSSEGDRNMMTMLNQMNQLQSQVAFDRTEAGGVFDTDYSGAQRAEKDRQIAEKVRQIAERDAHIRQLILERGHLQSSAQQHLTYLQSTSSQAIRGVRAALGVFEDSIRSDGVALQQMMHKDASARQTAPVPPATGH